MSTSQPDLPTLPQRPGARITMLGRPGCHLCDDARETIQRIAAELGIEWEELCIDNDPRLLREFAEEIPVTFIDGVRHDYWSVSETRLRAALARA